MKFIISTFFLLLSFTSLANSESISSVESKKDATIIGLIDYDRGKKKNRRNKRINKKRKRKCGQFGRKAYAG